MMSSDSRSPFPNTSGRLSVTPPKLGSSRVKSPLPAPAAYRSGCMSAAAKRYKVRTCRRQIPLHHPAYCTFNFNIFLSQYLRRIFHFRQMDFEFAIWQMLYLFYKPQNVYRNFQYRKVSDYEKN